MNQLAIGIDFGTTKTLVSFFNESSGKPETIRLGRGRDDLPTSIYVSREGEFLFGEDADDWIEFGADRYCRAFKMRLGSPSPVLTLIEGNRIVPYSAKQLTGIFLRHIKKRCEEEAFMGKTIRRAVITRPVRFSPVQCEELKQAAENAGFSDVTFATEPEAAGYAFCRLCPDGAFKGNALVIDWGGGTLDMALVSREGDRLATHREYIDGNTNMGGEVFDERLWNEVVRRLKEADGTDLSRESPEQRNMIARKVRYAKEMLSGKSQYALRLSCSKGACEPVVLERSDWERMIAPDVEQAAGMAERLMKAIQEQALKPELMILVGGSSLIPLIARTMESVVGLPCRKWQFGREAVSLGAALLSASHDQQPYAQTDAESSQVNRQEETVQHLELTPQEMQQGCTKTISIRGMSLEVSIPPHIKPNSILRIPSDQTENGEQLLVIINEIRAHDIDGKSFYLLGLEYLHGINGRKIDYRKAAVCFTKGYENGDLNAGYMLCACYQEGLGVPINSAFVITLAEFLIRNNYFPAYRYLAEAWQTGQGVPMNHHTAKDFSDKLEKYCAHPMEGIDEILRYDALLINESNKESPDTRKWERLAKENFQTSHLPTRFGLLAIALSRDLESPSAQEELRSLLDEGCQQGDYFSLFLKGSILCGEETAIYTPNKTQGIQLLEKIIDCNIPLFLFGYCAAIEDDAPKKKKTMQQFWTSCCLGPSCLKKANDLNCRIELETNPCIFWQVYEKDIVLSLFDSGQLDQLITRVPPLIVLKNENTHTLNNIKVRVCSQDTQMDRTISIDQSIDPNSSLKINPIDYNLELGKHLYIEVSSENRCSRMELDTADGTHDFMAPTIPPLIMWCERGVWGVGFSLKLFCVEGDIHNVVVYNHNGARTRPIFLGANAEPTSIDGSKFHDSIPLLENEIFKIESAGYPNIIGKIPHQPPEQNQASFSNQTNTELKKEYNQKKDIPSNTTSSTHHTIWQSIGKTLEDIPWWMVAIGISMMIRGCSK